MRSCQRSTAGADVVITGRVADPSLFVAPLRHAFGWAGDDWATLGAGTLVGHLMECAAQITGGYFADPAARRCRASPTSAFRSRRSRRRPRRDHQARGGRRPGQRAHGQGAAALRGARPGSLRHARRRRRLQPGRDQGRRRRSRRGRRRGRAAAPGAAQGHGRLRRRPARRSRHLLRRGRGRRHAPRSPARSSKSACARCTAATRRCGST